MIEPFPPLENLYKKLKDKDLVAYVDETYASPDGQTHNGFYTICAVLYEACEIKNARNDFIKIAAGNYWHSTQALQTADGQAKFSAMVNELSRFQDPIVVAVKLNGNFQKESDQLHARSEALEKLAVTLSLAYSHRIKGLIVEKSRRQRLDNLDRTVITKLYRLGTVPKSLQMLHCSPSSEPLLWTPDITAMAWRRAITHTDASSREFVKLGSQCHIVSIDSERTIHEIPKIPTGNALLDEIYGNSSFLESLRHQHLHGRVQNENLQVIIKEKENQKEL
ncbi:hypothetical protein BRL53_05270 [Corynebacterium ulcerans]|uniref:hypothetical protein n=1 Tax=Corynebacterium ulcerans TaxID=65058 RepID=UPI000C762D7E|nr:hypothetical protein [Corynebacterium ulcerans]PLW00145.1 hypothetical protein BRL53_05270 [Corynebacterium ulcerans]